MDPHHHTTSTNLNNASNKFNHINHQLQQHNQSKLRSQSLPNIYAGNDNNSTSSIASSTSSNNFYSNLPASIYSRISSPSSSPCPTPLPVSASKKSRSYSNHYHNNSQGYRARKHVNYKKKGSLSFRTKSNIKSTTASENKSQNLNSTDSSSSIIPDSNTSYLPQFIPPVSSVSSSIPDFNNPPVDLLPPVNVSSLREIELQEIIKNPQLRHDIVFDPQLQFRPNLDGERGRRKKASTEQYWNSVVSECEALATAKSTEEASRFLNANNKLPYLFVTLRDILDSLLPARDREYVDSVLDPEYLMQRLEYGALDFSALANWLATIFKLHCAPMRDSWVDQMVARVENGVDNKSPRRIVEGLRMMFAILEAMKLDVANHQIRTLRPVMVENAIDFEQDYYTQMIEKGKFDLEDSLKWYANNLAKYLERKQQQQETALRNTNDNNNNKTHLTDNKSTSRRTMETYRSAFVYGLIMLLPCASEEAVTEFPSTFGFDFARLAGFRAEVRQVVCMHLCVSLFKELLQAQLTKDDSININTRRQMLAAALTTAEIDRMKQDILSIVGDSYGNAKWTKNTCVLGLEIAKRVELACNAESPLYSSGNSGNNSTTMSSDYLRNQNFVPNRDLKDMAENWLSKHLQPKSPIYKIVETKIINALIDMCCKSTTTISTMDQPTSLSKTESYISTLQQQKQEDYAKQQEQNQQQPKRCSFSPEVCAEREISAICSKSLVLIQFHWGVFSKFYIHYASLGDNDEDDLGSTYSSSSLSDGNNNMRRSNKNKTNENETPISNTSNDNNEITQSL